MSCYLLEIYFVLSVRACICFGVSVTDEVLERGERTTSKFIPPARRPTKDEERTMVALGLEEALLTVFNHHVYSFGQEIHRQLDGGPTGLTATGAAAKVFMLDWCETFQEKLKKATTNIPSFNLYLHKLYVDDNNFATEELPPGTRLKGDVMVVEPEAVEADQLVPGDERTARLMQELANTLCPFIQMTADYPSAHPNGWMPILNVSVQVTADNMVDFKHYRKPMASPYTILNASAMPGLTKRLTLVQEGIQMLRNTRPSLHPRLRRGLMEDLAERMMVSGYNADYRRGIIESAVKGYEAQVAADLAGEKPLYRPRGWQQESRRRRKRMKRAAWYRPADTVLFCPATPGSELASRLRKVAEEEGKRINLRVRVVEKGGVSLRSQRVKTDLAAGEPCAAPNCMMCLTGGGGGGLRHHRAGALYHGLCKICEEEGLVSEYWGESGDSAYARCLDHKKDIEKKDLSNAFAKHLNLHHPTEEGKPETIKFKLEKTFQKPAPRQVAEAVKIHNSKADRLLNSKAEWEQPSVDRVIVTREPRQREGGGGGRGSSQRQVGGAT